MWMGPLGHMVSEFLHGTHVRIKKIPKISLHGKREFLTELFVPKSGFSGIVYKADIHIRKYTEEKCQEGLDI